MRRLIKGARRAAGLDPPGRDLGVRDEDVFITSYPRSGNTWLRFLIANLFDPTTDHTLRTVANVVPDIYKASAKDLDRMRGRRLIKSHEYFDPRYVRVIYLVRDPRDIAVSWFYYARDRGSIPAGTDIEAWTADYVSGKASRYGTWKEHVEGWLATRGDSEAFLLVRYEDLTDDPAHVLGRIGTFLDAGWRRADMDRAVEKSSVGNIKAAEAKEETATPGTTARRGRAGGWIEELPRDGVGLIESRFGTTMRKLGYELSR